MGGEIGVESVPGEGSTFWFTLPLPRGSEQAQGPSVAPADLDGIRVLVVDDVEINLQVLTEQLTAWGMRPETASSGADALERLDRDACLAAGMDDFVGKPIMVEDLSAALTRWGGATDAPI